MIEIEKGGHRKVESYRLSHHACLLCPMSLSFKEGDLNKYSVIQKTWITATDGKRYEANVYNLDMIIAVGYRVNSYKATRFR